MARRFGGVMGPLVTPFKADESLDIAGFETNVRAHMAAGLEGVLVAGSTGEAALLGDDERRILLEAARRIVPTELTLLAGTGAESSRHCIARCRDAASSGADAVLVVAPHYYTSSMTPAAIKAHFLRVADESPLPVLLYNIPKYMHFRLEPELIAELARHENIRGMKDSAGDMTFFARYVESQSDKFDVMTGHGGTFATALKLGGQGGILAVALFSPELALEVWESSREGRTADADAAQKPLVPQAAEIVARMGVPGVKAAMERIGLVGGSVRLPLLPIAPSDAAMLDGLLKPVAVTRDA
ncbi:MAG TPA: dihydrodipicolinate synthase family protein [Gemmatimonadaceae bacterium]|nr:dihydrodipicolinate synthase family protein [Gemmatimonadaceae bacterium]